jgi:transposase InsO family protein
VITSNAHKYSISALCRCLGIARSTYYYEAARLPDETPLERSIQTAFQQNRSVYGSRKIQTVLRKQGMRVSRRRICRIMKRLGLESAYAKKRYKAHTKECNETPIPNELARQFHGQKPYAVVVSDLTYVRVNHKWHYICILLDLHNREVIGYSDGANKDAQLVYDAFASLQVNLSEIQIFHTDRGSEFNNQLIDDMLDAFQIKRSLSLKGCPYDNAVAEATFKIFKAEFVDGRNFYSIEQMRLELADYVHWFNHIRIHGTLGYLSPVQFRQHPSSFLSD